MSQINNQNDSRFREWIREQSQFQNGTADANRVPFETWLDEKIGKERALKRPTLRDQNPPESKLREFEQFTYDLDTQSDFEKVSLAVGGVLTLLLGLGGGVVAAIFTLGAVGFLYYKWPYAKRLELNKRRIDDAPIPLDVYNTEFTSPLVDRSVVRITVHFQIPRGLAKNVAASSSYVPTDVPSDLAQNLNRVTEAKLVIYTQVLAEPPSRLNLEEYLNYELTQFQDENRISVMRVTVPIAIHVHPDKPKGVNV